MVFTVVLADQKFFNMPDIMFTKEGTIELHFLHDGALVIKLIIARCYARGILMDIGSLVDICFLSFLRHIKFDESVIVKITMNLVGFNGEPSVILAKWSCHYLLKE